MPNIYRNWVNVSKAEAYSMWLGGTMGTTGASKQMLELQVWMTCPQCLPSVYLFFLLLLRCQVLSKTPDFISGWPFLSQTPLCSSVHGKEIPTSSSPQLCHLLLSDIHVGICFMCWQMLLCGFQCVSVFLLSSVATYLKLKGGFVCFH